MSNQKVSADALVEFWRILEEEQKVALANNPGKVKEFLKELVTKEVQNTYVVALSDDGAVKLLVENKKYESEERAKEIVANWRKYASNVGYTGPVAWKVKAGFMLKLHAPLAGPCYDKLKYLQNWNIRNDEPTKDSLVFWVPRLADGSTSQSIPQMEKLREKYRKNYSWPVHHCKSFGSIALLFALILAHFKRMGERVPLNYLYAASDTFHVAGSRLVAGDFGEDGLYCYYWREDARGFVGFFLLGVEELGQ